MGATLADLNDFITYLNQQINICQVNGTWYGQPYVWGAQHTRLTPSNYQTIINNNEEKVTDRVAAKQYCKRLFDAGMSELFAYDCNGLGMYYWYNLKHLTGDWNANGMMSNTTLYPDHPKRGWWVFRVRSSDGRAYHVGYMVDDNHTIESQGRSTGVIKQEFSSTYWQKWGIPKVLKEVIPAPGDPGHTWVHFMSNYLWAPGGNYFFPQH